MKHPVLRFKDEQGHSYPDYILTKLEHVASVCGGGTPSTSNENYWNGDIQWLTPTEINSKYVHSSQRTITQEGLNNSSAKLLPIGAILLTTRATIGACSINNYDGKVCTNQGFQSLICNDCVLPEYLYYSITLPSFQKEMIKNASGSTFLELSPRNLKKLPVKIPSLPEQQKIASFFSSLDEKISLAERRLEALEQLKKGLMQKIFSQELRFKDENGNSFPEWSTKSFSEIFTFLKTNSLTRAKLNHITGNIKNIHYGDILTTLPTILKSSNILIPFINQSESDKEFEILKQGDIIIADAAEDYTVGKSIELADVFFPITSGLHTIACRPKITFAPSFLGYYLNSPEFHNQLIPLVTGTKVFAIIKSEIIKTTITFPCLKEQQKIASLFSVLDEKSFLSKRKLEALNQLKKGFMQQMFV